MSPIIHRRKERRLSQQALAARLGISRASLSRIERGRQEMSRDLIRRMSEELGIPVDILVQWRPDAPSRPENGGATP